MKTRDVCTKTGHVRRILEGSHDSGREGHCLRRDLSLYAKTLSPLSVSTITHQSPTRASTHTHTRTHTIHSLTPVKILGHVHARLCGSKNFLSIQKHTPGVNIGLFPILGHAAIGENFQNVKCQRLSFETHKHTGF